MTPASNHKTTLTVIIAAQALAVFVYVGLTYLVPVPPRDAPPILLPILEGVAVVSVVIGVLMERTLLARAEHPGAVQAAGIVSSALGEASAIYGLIVYFLTGERIWFFFLLSLLYFARMALRLPEMYRLMDEKA